MPKKSGLKETLQQHVAKANRQSLSQSAEVDPGVLSRFVSGQRDVTLETASRLAEALHLRLVKNVVVDNAAESSVSEVERDLCTAIHKQLERMRDISNKWNNFKFDPALYKQTVQQLFDLVSKASRNKDSFDLVSKRTARGPRKTAGKRQRVK